MLCALVQSRLSLRESSVSGEIAMIVWRLAGETQTFVERKATLAVAMHKC